MRMYIHLFADAQNNPHHLCMVIYYIPPEFCPKIASHGNSKDRTREHHTTWASTREIIKSEPSCSGPKATVARVSTKVGGLLDTSCPGQLPRSERQVMYVRQKSKCLPLGFPQPSWNPADELYTVMFQAKQEDSNQHFSRDMKVLPEPAIILATEQQLNDLVRFCTSADRFGILTVDPTFSLGEFDVTPVTYRHLLLNCRRSGKAPVCVGPILIHYRKTFTTNHFFASALTALARGLEHLRAFGTDGEEALVTAFQQVFSSASHLACSIHMRRNIKEKLQDLGFPSGVIASYLQDIFGQRQEDTLIEGLVDAEDESNYAYRLSCLVEKWLKREQELVGAGLFTEWFQKYKSDIIRDTMIKVFVNLLAWVLSLSSLPLMQVNRSMQ